MDIMKSIRPVKKLSDEVLAWLMPLPPHHLIISCFIKFHNGFTFLVLAYPRCPGKEAIKCVSYEI